MTTAVLKKCAKCGVDISVVGVTYTFNGDCFCVRCLPVTGMMEIPMTHSEALKEEGEYLGDGLYASFDGWQFRLWTERENGVHEVYLEPSVVARFNAYATHKMLKGEKS